jgi:hypothetical protein
MAFCRLLTPAIYGRERKLQQKAAPPRHLQGRSRINRQTCCGLLRMMLIFQGGILPAGVGTASDDLDHLPVAGRHRAVPYARLDELAPCAMCRAKHNIPPDSASSNQFRFRALANRMQHMPT